MNGNMLSNTWTVCGIVNTKCRSCTGRVIDIDRNIHYIQDEEERNMEIERRKKYGNFIISTSRETIHWAGNCPDYKKWRYNKNRTNILTEEEEDIFSLKKCRFNEKHLCLWININYLDNIDIKDYDALYKKICNIAFEIEERTNANIHIDTHCPSRSVTCQICLIATKEGTGQMRNHDKGYCPNYYLASRYTCGYCRDELQYEPNFHIPDTCPKNRDWNPRHKDIDNKKWSSLQFFFNTYKQTKMTEEKQFPSQTLRLEFNNIEKRKTNNPLNVFLQNSLMSKGSGNSFLNRGTRRNSNPETDSCDVSIGHCNSTQSMDSMNDFGEAKILEKSPEEKMSGDESSEQKILDKPQKEKNLEESSEQ